MIPAGLDCLECKVVQDIRVTLEAQALLDLRVRMALGVNLVREEFQDPQEKTDHLELQDPPARKDLLAPAEDRVRQVLLDHLDLLLTLEVALLHSEKTGVQSVMVDRKDPTPTCRVMIRPKVLSQTTSTATSIELCGAWVNSSTP